MAEHHFQVVDKSHSTSVSSVYEAVNPEGGRRIVEVLSVSTVGPWLDTLREDMAALARLRHPCILETLDVGTLPDGTPVIVSERPEGITLARWLAPGRVAGTEAAIDLLAGVAHALEAAHQAGVSHGALAVENVFLIPMAEHALGFPRVRGFGHRWLRAAAAYGNVPTMAPGVRTVPAPRREIAADIAALAAIADRLLTPLQRGPRLAAVLRAAQQPGDERFASAPALIEAVELAVDTVGPEEHTNPGRPLARRGRAARSIVASAVLTVAGACALHFWMVARAARPSVRTAHESSATLAGEPSRASPRRGLGDPGN
jgi:hypothetical protein